MKREDIEYLKKWIWSSELAFWWELGKNFSKINTLLRELVSEFQRIENLSSDVDKTREAYLRVKNLIVLIRESSPVVFLDQKIDDDEMITIRQTVEDFFGCLDIFAEKKNISMRLINPIKRSIAAGGIFSLGIFNFDQLLDDIINDGKVLCISGLGEKGLSILKTAAVSWKAELTKTKNETS